MRALLAVLVLVTLAFAGCASKGGDDDVSETGTGTSSGSSTSTSATSTQSSTSTSATGTGAPANHAPTVNFTSNVTSGPAPLSVNFTLNGTDVDGDDLNWTLSFGDNSTNLTGSTFPTDVVHTFTSTGNYTARLDVSDGMASVNRSVTIKVMAGVSPAPTGTPVTWSGVGQGTAVDICLTMGADGEPYLYFDEALAGTWHYTATSTVPGAVIKTEWWAGDAFVANQGATGVIPAGADNVAVCGDAPTLTIDFELTLSPV